MELRFVLIWYILAGGCRLCRTGPTKKCTESTHGCYCEQDLQEDGMTVVYASDNSTATFYCNNSSVLVVWCYVNTSGGPNKSFGWNSTVWPTCEIPSDNTAQPPVHNTSTESMETTTKVATDEPVGNNTTSIQSTFVEQKTTPTNTESSNTSPERSTTSNMLNQDTSTVTQTTNTSVTSASFSNKEESHGSRGPLAKELIAAIAVGAVVCGAIAIVFIIFIRRRRKQGKNDDDKGHTSTFGNGAYESTYANIGDEPTCTPSLTKTFSVPDTDSGYADIEIPLEGDYNHIGFIPARHAGKPKDGSEHKSKISDDYSHISPGDHKSPATDDPSYSHIGGVARSKISASISSERDKDLTYDHLASEPSMKRPHPRVSNDHSGIDTECEYNHINDVTPKLLQPIAEPDNDTYNHISTKVQGSCSSKNTVQQEIGPKQPYNYATVCKTKTNKELETDDCDQVEDGGPSSHAYFILEKQF